MDIAVVDKIARGLLGRICFYLSEPRALLFSIIPSGVRLPPRGFVRDISLSHNRYKKAADASPNADERSSSDINYYSAPHVSRLKGDCFVS